MVKKPRQSPMQIMVPIGYGVWGWRGSNYPILHRIVLSSLKYLIIIVTMHDLSISIRHNTAAKCHQHYLQSELVYLHLA